MAEQLRKAPALEKDISQVSENDIKVRVIGEITQQGENFIKIKDETGEIQVQTLEKHAPGKTVRVLGIIEKDEDGIRILADVIQNMDTLDKKVYKRMRVLTQSL